MKKDSVRYPPWLFICLSLLGLLFLTACAQRNGLQNAMKDTGGEENEFMAGYLDGCESGRWKKGDSRLLYFFDAIRAANHAAYAEGWQKGHDKCQ